MLDTLLAKKSKRKLRRLKLLNRQILKLLKPLAFHFDFLKLCPLKFSGPLSAMNLFINFVPLPSILKVQFVNCFLKMPPLLHTILSSPSSFIVVYIDNAKEGNLFFAFGNQAALHSFFNDKPETLTLAAFRLGSCQSFTRSPATDVLLPGFRTYIDHFVATLESFGDAKIGGEKRIRLSAFWLALLRRFLENECLELPRLKVNRTNGFFLCLFYLFTIALTRWKLDCFMKSSFQDASLKVINVFSGLQIQNAISVDGLLLSHPRVFLVQAPSTKFLEEVNLPVPVLGDQSSETKSSAVDIFKGGIDFETKRTSELLANIRRILSLALSDKEAQARIEETYRHSRISAADLIHFSKSKKHWSSRFKKLYAAVFSENIYDYTNLFNKPINDFLINIPNTELRSRIRSSVNFLLNAEAEDPYVRNQNLFIFLFQKFFNVLSDQATTEQRVTGDKKFLSYDNLRKGAEKLSLVDAMSDDIAQNIFPLIYIYADVESEESKESIKKFFCCVDAGTITYDSDLLSAYINFRYREYIVPLIPDEIPKYVCAKANILKNRSASLIRDLKIKLSLASFSIIDAFALAINLPEQPASHKLFTLETVTEFRPKTKSWHSVSYVCLNEVVFSALQINVLDLISSFSVAYNLPMVCPPQDWVADSQLGYKNGGYLTNNYKKFLDATHRNSYGPAVDFSEQGLAAINKIQKKPYRFKHVSSEFWYSSVLLNELGILSQDQLKVLSTELETLRKNLKSFEESNSVVLELRLKRRSLKSQLFVHNKILNKPAFSEAKSSLQNEIAALSEKIKGVANGEDLVEEYGKLKMKTLELTQELFSQNEKYKRHEFNYDILCTFENTTIYFPHGIDFRGRVYPYVGGIHKAAGSYKHFLLSEASVPYDATGIYHLSLAVSEYAHQDPAICKYFGIEKSKQTVENLHKFFTDHKASFKSGELINRATTLSARFAFEEIQNALNIPNYSSRYLLPIDQNASGPALLACVFKDYFLAESTNLCSSSFGRQDIYTIWLTQFMEKLEKTHPFRPILSRTFAKEILMPYFYNMGLHGIVEVVKSHLQTSDISFRIKDIRHFAQLILESLRALSLGMAFITDFFDSLAVILTEVNGSLVIRTPDYTNLEFGYFKTAWITLATTLKSKGKRKRSITYNLPIVTDKIDLSSQKRSLLPNFVHTLDAYFVREISLKFFEKFGYSPQSLHDCFYAHPSQTDDLLKIIKNVYIDAFSNSNFIVDVLLRPCEYRHASEKYVLALHNLKDEYDKHVRQLRDKNTIFDLSNSTTQDSFKENPYSFIYGD